MKIKLDENLPRRLAEALARIGHDVHTVHQEQLSGSSDTDVWRAAQEEDRFLITQDLNFSDLRHFEPGTHAGILLVRLRDPGRTALLRRVQGLFEKHGAEEWTGCLVVVTDRKLRIRCPEN